MKTILRHRSVLILLAPLLVLAALWFTDPDGGASTGIWLLRVATAIIAVAAAHWIRKATFDYPEADLRTLFGKAREEPTGAGLALVAVAVFMAAVLSLFAGQVRAQDVATYIPANAQTHLATLAAEQRAHWPDHPRPAVLAALVEHESCISLTHSRCWNPASKLKTSREEGAGLGQITRAYRQDGSLRFDALADMRGRHPALSEWSWENVYRRPDLQLRALILMNRDNFHALHRTAGRGADLLAFTDAAYNGGLGGVQAERRACAAVQGCDPRRWFGHVEHRCLKSRAALYGNRSACDINRGHVADVFRRTPKYDGLVMSEPEVAGVQYAIYGEASTEPGVDRVVFDAKALGPVEKVHRFSLELDQMERLRIVGALLLGGSPPAVLGAVILGPINPINRHSVWTGAHVSQEVFERTPSFANANTLVVVVRGRGPLGNSTPGVHAAPDVVSPGASLAMGFVSTPGFLLQAPARLDVATAKPRGADNSKSPAVAGTSPVVDAPIITGEIKNYKPFEAFSNQVGFHVAIVDANMAIVDDVTQQYEGRI